MGRIPDKDCKREPRMTPSSHRIPRPDHDATTHRNGQDCTDECFGMRPEAEIRARLADLMEDERLHYKRANVLVNAPLALIQVEGHAEAWTLAWVLGEPAPKWGKP